MILDQFGNPITSMSPLALEQLRDETALTIHAHRFCNATAYWSRKNYRKKLQEIGSLDAWQKDREARAQA